MSKTITIASIQMFVHKNKKQNVKQVKNHLKYLSKVFPQVGMVVFPELSVSESALEPDCKTAKGITFYKHGETPGLGGEIEKAWFQDNFKGKRFVDDTNSLIGIKVLKGAVDETSKEAYCQVDGISGATITSKGLESFLREDLSKYEPFFKPKRAVAS